MSESIDYSFKDNFLAIVNSIIGDKRSNVDEIMMADEVLKGSGIDDGVVCLVRTLLLRSFAGVEKIEIHGC